MTPRICIALLLLTPACQLDPKNIGDPTGGDSSGTTGEVETDGNSSEPATTSMGSPSEPVTTTASESVGTSESGSTSQGTSEGSTSVGTSESGSTSQGTSESGGPPPVDCSQGPENFPSFPKACQIDDDCAVGLHAIDCCGSLLAIGIQAGDAKNYMEAEGICLSQYPLCDCIPDATVAEDNGVQGDNEDIGVVCKDQQCMTIIVDPCSGVDLPACPGECPPEQFPADCGQPCEDEGSACGNNIGDGMACTAGVWTCTVHPPQGEGCNLVCK